MIFFNSCLLLYFSSTVLFLVLYSCVLLALNTKKQRGVDRPEREAELFYFSCVFPHLLCSGFIKQSGVVVVGFGVSCLGFFSFCICTVMEIKLFFQDFLGTL